MLFGLMKSWAKHMLRDDFLNLLFVVICTCLARVPLGLQLGCYNQLKTTDFSGTIWEELWVIYREIAVRERLFVYFEISSKNSCNSFEKNQWS